ncbi:MAG: branched-chain amino acid ABC transporter permease [Firmicutes bacterium]|nr:branched-chain amino acid ABC transporter permease [Bacillota bacterium]
MDFWVLGQYAVNILFLAGIYGCVGLGFSLVYGVMNIINLAHGSLIMMGAYTTFWLFTSYGIDPFLSIPLSAVLFFMIGYFIQGAIINRVMKTGIFMIMILTYGIEIILVNLALYLWKANYRSVAPAYSGNILELGSITIPYLKLAILAATVLITVCVYLFINKTKTGMAIQATSLNRYSAQLVGIDIHRIYNITYGVSTALAATAGALIASVYPIFPSMEGPFLGKAFVIAVLGGLGNMAGALVGGLGLAVAETVGSLVFGASYQNVTAFAVFVIILVLRPYGLVGKRFFAEISS